MFEEKYKVGYKIYLSDPATRMIKVEYSIWVDDYSSLIFFMPNWTPGSYKIRDYAKRMFSIKAHAGNIKLTLKVASKSSWIVDCIPGRNKIVYEMIAADYSVRGIYCDSQFIFLNGASLFLYHEAARKQPCSVEFIAQENLPQSWRLKTSLKPLLVHENGYGCYIASSYDDLIDHPCLIGSISELTFTVAEVQHSIFFNQLIIASRKITYT